MDLDDLLEELLEDAARRARRGAQRVAAATSGGRRRVRRVVRAVSLVAAALMLVLGAAMVAIGDAGAIRLLLGGLLLAGGLGSAAVGAVAQVLERRDPVVQRERAIARGEIAADVVDEDLRELPRDVRGDFRRLLASRRLVQDLAHDGWIEGRAVVEADGQIARLHHLLVTERRTADLGGHASPALRAQVGDLADLLVALADEAVHAQAEALVSSARVQVTLEDARVHLATLREARREVDRVDVVEQRSVPGTG